MKRIIACLILLALCLAAFASCGEDPVVEEKSNLSAAREYLFTMYKNSAAKTLLDFKRVSVITISGEEFTVEWTAEVKSGPADGVKIVANDDKTVTIDINETPEEEMNYTITATLKKGDETESVSFDH
ncbi:MAG: hypothetical protein KBS59_01310, partial [Clostridiales bacterium]|nr:hypothetical protein [Clostridiales bacterium]